MNIEVQKRDDNIVATISNEYRLLSISEYGVSIYTNLNIDDKYSILKLSPIRKKIFIRKCMVKLANELLKVNKE